MSVEQGSPLVSPNVAYTKDVNVEIGCVADLIDDLITRSPVRRSASCMAESVTQWAEVEIIALPSTDIDETVWCFDTQRLFMRQDIVFDGPERGDLYNLFIEKGVWCGGFHSTSRRASTLYLPEEEPDEFTLAVQSYLPDPCFETILREDDVDYNDLMKIARIARHDFYSPNRLTQYELEGLFDLLAFIDDALRHGTDILSN